MSSRTSSVAEYKNIGNFRDLTPLQMQRLMSMAQDHEVLSLPDTESKSLVPTVPVRGMKGLKPNLGMGRPPKFKPLPKRKKPGKTGWRDVTAGNVADYGWKAFQMAKQMWKLINVEQKVFDVDGSAGVALTTTSIVANLSNIAQGTDYFNRIGDSILAQRFEFRIRCSGNVNKPSHTFRVLLVEDKEQDGVDPAIGDVLQGLTSPLVAPRNVFGLQRFNVLYDHLHTLNQTALVGATPTYVINQEILPSKMSNHNRHLKYDATAGADASNREGALFLMAVAGDGADGPTIYYSFRLVFTDN